MSDSLRVIDQWVEWIEAALPGIAAGDQVKYEIAFTMAEVGPGQQAPAMVITMFSPGVLLGTTTHTIAVLPNPSVATEEGVVNVLRSMMENVRQERQRQLAGGGPDPMPPLNGAGPPGGPGPLLGR